MHEVASLPLETWSSFYVIVGSSAGALIGLQFVVMTLIGEAGSAPGRSETISAFGAPNVVHFSAALLMAAILSAPWPSVHSAGIAVAICGLLGVMYSYVVWRRALSQGTYQPVFEDWLWHTVLPFLAYAALLVTGLLAGRSASVAMFVLGAAVLLLVFVGIHNAWDTVTYVAMQQAEVERKAKQLAKQEALPKTPPTSLPQ